MAPARSSCQRPRAGSLVFSPEVSLECSLNCSELFLPLLPASLTLCPVHHHGSTGLKGRTDCGLCLGSRLPA